jgi:hypothetical protein
MASCPAVVILVAACAGATLAGCGPDVTLPDGEGDGQGVPMIPPSETGPSANLAPGGTANVTADFLNLRDKAGTDGNILIAMPCGSLVTVQAGPTTTPVSGWWQVLYSTPDGTPYSGWCSGKFLIATSMFDPNSCGSPVVSPDGGGGSGMLPPTMVPAIFDRAKSAVGYSYWWGHGAWRTDGVDQGSCTGSCPSCDHGGSYGADCSGFVAKAWQVPSSSALGVDEHPYSTYEFYNAQTYWTQIDRATLAPADALVRRDATSGHIALVESASDPYGSIWLYEARGCATGVVHNLRSVDSSYRAIRRDGL